MLLTSDRMAKELQQSKLFNIKKPKEVFYNFSIIGKQMHYCNIKVFYVRNQKSIQISRSCSGKVDNIDQMKNEIQISEGHSEQKLNLFLCWKLPRKKVPYTYIVSLCDIQLT